MKKPTNDKLFEVMIRDCIEEHYPGKLFSLWGRNGQEQNGCDVISTDHTIIVQCKCYDENKSRSYNDFVEGITDAYNSACGFFSKMTQFIAATTLDRDTKTQQKLFELQKDIQIQTLFWEDVEDLYERFDAKYHLEEVKRALKDKLEEDRDLHPSFRLMNADEIDRRLFPDYEAPDLETKAVERDGVELSPVWELVRRSWELPENHSIVIEGAGGIGKTVALFTLTKAHKGEISVPAIYVPLHKLVDEDGRYVELSAYLIMKFPSHYEQINRLACRKWVDGPHLLLLLDGFNEIPGEKRQRILGIINEWRRSHGGAQLIAVSRPMDDLALGARLAGKAIKCKLKPLSEDEVRSFLRSKKCPAPANGAPIWKNLVFPLFLILYWKTGKLGEETETGYPLACRETNGGGALIWNFLQRELLKKEDHPGDEDWPAWCAIACEYLIPYIAYQMAVQGWFSVENTQATRWIDEALSGLNRKTIPSHLRSIFNLYRNQYFKYPARDNLTREAWYFLVLRDTGVLVPSDEKKEHGYFSFLHQNFRDCLAAIHLINQAETAGDTLPAAWAGHQDTNVLNYAAELMEPEAFQSVWEANRNTKPTNHTATATLLELARRKKYARNETLPDLDFSGMNLRGFSLTRYLRQDTNLGLFRKPELSEKTELDFASFQSPGHSEPVSCLLLTSTGLVVSGSYDYTLRVWDPATGECLHTLEGHRGMVFCVIETKGGQLVSGSDDRTLRVWDPATGECLRTLKGHRGAVNCVIETKGGQLVSGSWDHTLRVWDPATGECLRTLKGHQMAVTCVIETKGSQLVSGSYDSTLRVWDPAIGECLRTLEVHSGTVTCVIETKGGQLVSGSDDATLRVWDPATGACLRILKGHEGRVICVMETNGGQLVSGSMGHTLQVWDPATGKCLRTLKGHEWTVTCVMETKGGQLVSGSGDGTLRVWDPATGECVRTLEKHRGGVNCVMETKAGQLVSGSDDRTLRVWDPATGKCLRTLGEHRGGVNCVMETKGGQLVSGSGNGTLRVWDPATGECLRTLKGHQMAVTCVIETKGGQLVSGSSDRTLRVWDPATGKCLRTLKGHKWTVTCVMETKGGQLASGSEDHTLRVWDPATGECLHTLEGHRGMVFCVIEMKGGQLVSGSDDHTLRVWDPATGACLRTLKGHTNSVTCITEMKDGQLVSGSYDSTLRVWDPATGECLRTLEGHRGDVNCVIETKGGQLASGSEDHTLRVWDPATGECLRALEGHQMAVTCVIETKGGQLVSGSEDHTLRVWDPATGECLRALEGHREVVTCAMETKGGQLVSGSMDGTMRVWDLSKGIGRECVEVLYPIEAGVSVRGLDFSRTNFPDDRSAVLPKMLWQNGATIPGKKSSIRSELSTD